ncbi:MAG: OmpA family protein [Myxococcota bacterium]
MNKRIYSSVAIIGLAIGSTSCGLNNTAKGGLIGGAGGAAVGAGIGAAISKNAKGAAIGAIIGAAVGGTAGALIGKTMDDRAKEIQKDLEGAKIQRVGEGILVTFDSGILFDVNSAELKPAAKENIQNLSDVLKKYDDTNIVIVGHTDSSGKDEYNAELSKRRADAVAEYARTHGIEVGRIKIVGEGEGVPVGSNDTAEGRAANRRVEVAIFANDELKSAAEAKAGN